MYDIDFEQRIGTTLCNKWTLERLLGVGGMAAVYVGVHKIGRRDAIKILRPEVVRRRDLAARFEQEARAANRFRHPGAVEIRDIDTTEDGAPFLVMELLEGESVCKRASAARPMPLPEILRLVDELLDVLSAAHALGIIHRDIKPDNLIVQPDGRLKVIDFGIARLRGVASSIVTGAGTRLGTIGYMSPEQTKGMSIDERTDIFAVGATMFRLIANRRIHEAEAVHELCVRMAATPAPSLADVAPHVPRDVCAVVDRALAYDVQDRYPDASTMRDDVRALRRAEQPPFATVCYSVRPRAERDAATSAGGRPQPQVLQTVRVADLMRMMAEGPASSGLRPSVRGRGLPPIPREEPPPDPAVEVAASAVQSVETAPELELHGSTEQNPSSADGTVASFRESVEPEPSFVAALPEPAFMAAIDEPSFASALPEPAFMAAIDEPEPRPCAPISIACSVPVVEADIPSRPVESVAARSVPKAEPTLPSRREGPVSGGPGDPTPPTGLTWSMREPSLDADFVPDAPTVPRMSSRPTWNPPPTPTNSEIFAMSDAPSGVARTCDGTPRSRRSLRRAALALPALLMIAVLVALPWVWRLRSSEAPEPELARAAPDALPALEPTASPEAASPPLPEAPAPAPPASAPPPSASAPPSPASAAPPPVRAPLLPGQGSLTFESPVEADVYVNGKRMGVANQPLTMPCGFRFMRLAASGGAGAAPAWLDVGRSIYVPCGGATWIGAHGAAPPEPPIGARSPAPR